MEHTTDNRSRDWSSGNWDQDRWSTGGGSDVSLLLWMAGGVALGALAMYLLDPDRGNRRRAMVRDKVKSAARTTRDTVETRTRDMADRARNMGSQIGSQVRSAIGQ